ncbi:MAG: selenium cofactor biosynthesis protein YqeC [Dehalococcoidales bacterium]|nr:selenium cofactor biosynthesis protein YqeC [Dehalococcoidales bacterium]
MVSHQKIGVNLRQAFDIRHREVISLVGGGGKTTLMFALAHELEAAGENVVSTTTTRILEPTAADTFLIVEPDEERLLSRVMDELKNHRHITLAAFKTPDGKLKGISPALVDRLASFTSEGGYIIVEADGAARKPLKAPNATEPVIPESTSLVIAVVGMDALGCRLTEENVFRPEIVSRLTGLAQGDKVTADTIATLITHAEGIIKGSPAHARIVPFINKIDIIKDPAAAEDLADKILGKGHPQIKRVVLGHVGVGSFTSEGWGLRVRE